MESGEESRERESRREKESGGRECRRRAEEESGGGEQTRRADEESRERETARGNRRVVEIGGEWRKEEWRVDLFLTALV